MKKLFLMLLVLSIVFSCTGCIDNNTYETAYDEGYNQGAEDGWSEGFDFGYAEALCEAPKRIDFYVEEDIWHLDFDIEDKYGIFPEDAFNVLENYAYGEPIPEDELYEAIWAAIEYYYDSRDIINDIEEYSLD